MAHNRKYVPGSIDLLKGRVLHDGELWNQDGIEKLITDSGMLENAPFKWIGLIYRYGTKNMLAPEYQRISKKWGDIPVAIELKMEILEWADRNNLKLLYDIFMIGALEAIIHIGKKYNLSIRLIENERAKFGQIPNSIEECEQYPAATAEDYKFLKEKFNTEINLCSNCGSVKATPKARQCLKCGEFHDPELV
jgi:ribosomal protein S27AE